MYKEDDSTSAAVLVEDGSFSWGADAMILIQLVLVFGFFSHMTPSGYNYKTIIKKNSNKIYMYLL